jgi:hypothetical protein
VKPYRLADRPAQQALAITQEVSSPCPELATTVGTSLGLQRLVARPHEWKSEHRGECRTKMFQGTHPLTIINNFNEIKERFNKQLEEYKNK